MRSFGESALRRLPRVTQRRSAGVPQIENGIGNGNEARGSSSTPKACVACDRNRQAISSTPQACGVVYIIRASGASVQSELVSLTYRRELSELVAQILEVIRADTHSEHLLNHWQEIGQ